MANFAAVEKLPAQNQSLLIAETSVTDTVTAITNSFTDNSSPLTKLGKSDVVATDAKVADAVVLQRVKVALQQSQVLSGLLKRVISLILSK